MRFLIILSVVILMLLHNFLTIKSIELAKKKYSEYIQVKQHELDPMGQNSVSKLFNVKYLLTSILCAFAIYYLISEYNYGNFTFFCLGMLIISYTIFVSDHIQNILTFKFIKANPHVLQGKIVMDKLYLLKVRQFSVISITFLLFLIYIYTMSSFVLGGICGCIIIYIHFDVLIRRHKSAKL